MKTTYTREEIMNIPAGRELDALVAEKVMQSVTCDKWILQRTTEVGNIYFKNENCGHKKCHPTQQPRKFSTDIAAAWEVFEFLTNNSVETVVRKENIESVDIGHDSSGWSCSIWWFKDIESSHAVEGIYADTAPLAICRAALLAVYAERTTP